MSTIHHFFAFEAGAMLFEAWYLNLREPENKSERNFCLLIAACSLVLFWVTR